MQRHCAICGAIPAPFGLRLPGLLSRLPPGKRGYLWTCGDDECRAQAEARRARVMEPSADTGGANG